MAEEKTHKVRITGIPTAPNAAPQKGPPGWYFEKQYPEADPFVVWVPVGTTVEVDDDTMNGWKRRESEGAPVIHYEKLGDGEAVDVSVVQALAAYEAPLIERGITVKGSPAKPSFIGKSKQVEGVFKGAPALGAKVPETESTKGGK